MGKFIKKVAPTEAEYVFQLTQSEVDMLGGIVSDLLDNPQRRVRISYEVDGSYVEPSDKGVAALRGAFAALSGIKESDGYDYFDYWTEVERLDSTGASVLD